MTKANIVYVVIVVVALLVIAAAQTTGSKTASPVGRYQLLSAKYRWPGIDAEHKVQFDESEHLFRIDSVTGETSILLLVATPDKNGQFQSTWFTIGKYPLSGNAR